MAKSRINSGIFAKKQLDWLVSLGEHLHHLPIIKDNILQLGLGTYIVLSAQATRMIRFPFIINQTIEFKDIRNLPRGV